MSKQRVTATIVSVITDGYAQAALWEGEGPGEERPIVENGLDAKKKDVVALEPLKRGKGSQGPSGAVLMYGLVPVLCVLGWVLSRQASLAEHFGGAALLGVPGLLLAWLVNRKNRMRRVASYRVVEVLQAYEKSEE